jgi:hypothetical protein
MRKCKPVFIKHRAIYLRRPRPKLPGSAAVLPALVTIAKSQRREVEALCRLMTQHSAAAQMLHYLLRWWKQKPIVRMSESDWINKLGLSKKEIRHGKKALEAAGIDVKVQSHKTGRATFFSINLPHFLKRLKTILGTTITSILKWMGVCLMGTDGSVPREPMGQSIGGQTVITESTQTLSHQNHDDDEKIPQSDSGEFALDKEGRDEQQQLHDASRKYLEENGVKTAKVLVEASKHPLEKVERAFALAQQHAQTNRAGYALAILQNGEYKAPPAWMRPDYKPIGTYQNSSAVKTGFQKSSWSEFAEEANV